MLHLKKRWMGRVKVRRKKRGEKLMVRQWKHVNGGGEGW